MFQEAIIQHLPTLKDMVEHKEVVSFTCGLLPDPSHLVELVYTLFITETLDFIYTDGKNLIFEEREEVLFASLYRESKIALPGHHLHKQFINFHDVSNFEDDERLYPRHPIYLPSRVFLFSISDGRVELEEMNKHIDTTDSSILIFSYHYSVVADNMFSVCCRISENQPITELIMDVVTFPDKTEPCTMMISEKNFRVKLFSVSMPTHLMTQLMKPISQATRVEFMEIRYTPLVGIKSFNLENKAASLMHLSLLDVEMDPELCKSLMKQIPFLTNLKFLKILPKSRFSLKEGYCHIPRDMCPEIMRSISHLNHLVYLDLTGNNLTGCLSNLVSDTDSELPSLQELYLQNTGITSNDVNHIINIIESRKLQI